jgi:hypothetical protein
VVVADGYNMGCTKRIRGLHVTMGNYTLTNDFYVVDLGDTNIVLGIQWLYSLEDINMNYKIMRMEFRDEEGRRVFLRGMTTYPPMIVSAKRMEAILRHKDTTWETKCLVTAYKNTKGCQHYPMDIQKLLGKHDKVFEQIPLGVPPNRGFKHTIELEEGTNPVISTTY